MSTKGWFALGRAALSDAKTSSTHGLVYDEAQQGGRPSHGAVATGMSWQRFEGTSNFVAIKTHVDVMDTSDPIQ
jgi:hypothetical protein